VCKWTSFRWPPASRHQSCWHRVTDTSLRSLTREITYALISVGPIEERDNILNNEFTGTHRRYVARYNNLSQRCRHSICMDCSRFYMMTGFLDQKSSKITYIYQKVLETGLRSLNLRLKNVETFRCFFFFWNRPFLGTRTKLLFVIKNVV